MTRTTLTESMTALSSSVFGKLSRSPSMRKTNAAIGAMVIGFGVGITPLFAADVETEDAPLANSVSIQEISAVLGTSAWFQKVYDDYLAAPLPGEIFTRGGVPEVFPEIETDPNPFGRIQTYNIHGDTITRDNAFFTSFGTNGRACITCHLPSDGMGLSLRSINKIFLNAGPTHTLFAPVDGSDCPSQVPANETTGALFGGLKGKGIRDFVASRSLLLTKGLIRVFIQIPDRTEYTLQTVWDPTGCNLDPDFNGGAESDDQGHSHPKVVSVFRRPRMNANMNFNLRLDTRTCAEIGTDPINGNLMWDGREPNLCTQALSATLGHAQADPANIDIILSRLDEIVAFETGMYAAQISSQSGALDQNGALGGPVLLASHDDGTLDSNDFAGDGLTFSLYDVWLTSDDEKQLSIARGQEIFNSRTFFISDVAGFSDFPTGPDTTLGNQSGTCSTCHNIKHGGGDIFKANQREIGVGGQAFAIGAPFATFDMPIFRLTCPQGSFLWDPTATTVTTNDPGKALITGKCRDIGKKTVPPMRALAAREPYFSDGSGRTLADVVKFYNNRFKIGLSEQEQKDLVNFLGAL